MTSSVLDFSRDAATGELRWALFAEGDLYRLWTPTEVFLLDEDARLIEVEEGK